MIALMKIYVSRLMTALVASIAFGGMSTQSQAMNQNNTHSFAAQGAAYTNMATSQLIQFANSGDKSAQFFLGNRYQVGSGVTKDTQQAFRWFMSAAQQGAAPAQLNVGQMYAVGKGVTKDLVQARQWLERAARQGDNRASYNLALISEHKQDLTGAYRWYELAARPEMLSDTVRQRARSKLAKLMTRLSSVDISRAHEATNSWLHQN